MSSGEKSTPPAFQDDGSAQRIEPLTFNNMGYGLNPQIRALAVILCLCLGLTLGLLFWSADAQDEIKIASSQQLAETALAIQKKSLRGTLTDYTYWDAAYTNMVEDLNLDWYHDEFGAFPYLTDNFGITSTLIVAPGDRVLLYTRDEETKTDAETVPLSEVASGLAGLVEDARRLVDDEFVAASSFVRMDGQPYLAAARIIHPGSDDMFEKAGVTPENATVAVFMTPLDESLLEALATDFGLMDLSYTTNLAGPQQLSVSLSTIDGESFGVLTWRIKRPSQQVFGIVLPALLAVIAFIGLLAWHLLRVISNGQQSLFTAMLEARAANRAKSEFLATMSHELRTPMNGVIGIAEVLKLGGLTDDQRMLLDHLSTAANDQLAIINDLLDITRIEAGRIELNDEKFDPASIVRAAVTLISSRADEKGLELQVELPDSEVAGVIGDPGRFKQVVLNLLSNAVKFTTEGKVTVVLASKTTGNSEEIVLTVVDTGIGISQEDQERIFDRFMQVDSSTKRKAQGSGLGLAICKALVVAMKGKIRLTSTPGEGTKVSVSLNLCHAGSDTETMRKVA